VKGQRFTLLPAPAKVFRRLVEGGTYFKKAPVEIELQTSSKSTLSFMGLYFAYFTL
jgi:hypothetical protein